MKHKGCFPQRTLRVLGLLFSMMACYEGILGDGHCSTTTSMRDILENGHHHNVPGMRGILENGHHPQQLPGMRGILENGHYSTTTRYERHPREWSLLDDDPI